MNSHASRSRTWSSVLVPVALALGMPAFVGCGAETALKPADFAGRYVLQSVDGHPVGWYKDLPAVDCAVAFRGTFTLEADRTFRLELPYDARCWGADPGDRQGVLVVYGSEVRASATGFVLNGWGPDVIAGFGADRWSLDVTPQGKQLTIRFRGFQRDFWRDPVLVVR